MLSSLSLRRKSMQMTKSLSHSVGGYLPNTLTEMWEPSRDFAFLRLPTSGARCIVALSGYDQICFFAPASVFSCLVQNATTGHGHLVRGLFLLVQH